MKDINRVLTCVDLSDYSKMVIAEKIFRHSPVSVLSLNLMDE